jgi:hypothetical protein
MEERGVSKEEVARLTLQVQERQMESAVKYLTQAYQILGKALGRDDKAKGSLADLAASVCSMADTVSGLYTCSEAKRNEVKELLTEATSEREDITGKFEMVDGKKKKIITVMNSGRAVKPPRDDTEAALTARHKIRMYELMYGTTDKVKENK